MGNTNKPSVPTYPTITSVNPYATATANKNGSSYTLNKFLTEQNKMIEDSVPALYQRLLNPTVDDAVSMARKNAFTNAFNQNAKNAFENNLINPLSKRNMLRSSLLNDMTKNFQNVQAQQISDFNNELLSNSISDTQSLINMLMNQYNSNASYGNNTLSAAQTDVSAVNSFNLNLYKQLLAAQNKNYYDLGNSMSRALSLASLL